MKKRALLTLLLIAALSLTGCQGEAATIAHTDKVFSVTVEEFVTRYNQQNIPNKLYMIPPDSDPMVPDDKTYYSQEGDVSTFFLVEDLSLALRTDEKGKVREIQLSYTRTQSEQNMIARDGFALHARAIIDLVSVPGYRLDAYSRLQPASQETSINYWYNGLAYKKAVEAGGMTLTVYPEKT